MNTKTMTKAVRDLVPGDVLCMGEGKSRLVVLHSRPLSHRSDCITYMVLKLGTLGELNAENRFENYPLDSQFMVEIPAGLTPVQAAADQLLGYARILRSLDDGRQLEGKVAIEDLEALQILLDELDPPKPPTLEEALALLRQVKVCNQPLPAKLGAAIVDILARVPN